MSNDLSPANVRTNAASLSAARRLEAIGGVVSSLDVAGIASRDEMTRVLCILELANKCIRIVLDEIRGTFGRDQLIEQSERLMQLIEVARNKVASLRLA